MNPAFRIKFSTFLSQLVGICLGLVILSLIAEYGFYSSAFSFILHQVQIIVAGVLIFSLLCRWLIAQNRTIFIRENQGHFILIFVFLLILGWIRHFPTPDFLENFLIKFLRINITTFGIQLYLVIYIILSLGRLNKYFSLIGGRLSNPVVLIPMVFAILILIGTLFLLLPRATSVGKPISFIDALFTATSATCVTGLIVKDIGTDFSRFGQIIVLTLIQIGALGIMTFTTFFGLILGRQLGIKEQILLKDVFSLETLGRIGRLVLGILLLTFIIEIIGAGLLFWAFIPYFGLNLHNFYLSVFHSISAFGNAGFSLFGDNFVRFQGHLGINLIITTLIILGGLGFMVIFDLGRWLKRRIKRQRSSLSLHSKVVLVVSILLIIVGTIFIFIRENNSALAGLSFKNKILGSYFQSVTARTAGFNTLPIAKFAPFSVLLLIILMFVGASPGSTGGGIKTSTLGVIFATIKSWMKGFRSVRIFRRTLSRVAINQAFCILFLSLIWAIVAVFILLQTEQGEVVDIIFEEISALGTVGLSRGITSDLSLIGKIIIITSMFWGRLAPLVIAIHVANKSAVEKYNYPEEKIVLG